MWGSAFYLNMKNTWPHHFTTRRGEGDGCAIKTNSTHPFLLRVPVPSQDVERYFACGNRVFELFWRCSIFSFSFYHSLLPVVNASWYFILSAIFFIFITNIFRQQKNVIIQKTALVLHILNMIATTRHLLLKVCIKIESYYWFISKS